MRAPLGSLCAALAVLVWLSTLCSPRLLVAHADEDVCIQSDADGTCIQTQPAAESAETPPATVDVEDFEDFEDEESYEDEDEDEEDDDGEEDEECEDYAEDCEARAQNNGCILEFLTMAYDCPRTCKLCHDEPGLERRYNLYSDVPQILHNDPELVEYADKVDEYIYETIYSSKLPDNIKLNCRNKEAQCTFFAHGGECSLNEEAMIAKCAAACMKCESGLEYSIRCPNDPNEPVAWESGDLNQMFANMVTQPTFSQYNPLIVSRPIANPNPKFEERNGPWIVVLNNFLSDQECEALIQLVEEQELERVEGDVDEEGVGHSFLQGDCDDECSQAEIVKRVERRVEHATGIPSVNVETFELMKFEEGDSSSSHSDYLAEEYMLSQGPRILSIVLFLDGLPQGNEDESNGGISFDSLDVVCRFG